MVVCFLLRSALRTPAIVVVVTHQCRIKITMMIQTDTLVSSDWLGKIVSPSPMKISYSGGNVRLKIEIEFLFCLTSGKNVTNETH